MVIIMDFTRIEQRAAYNVANAKIPGCAVGILKSGETVFRGVYGYADPDKKKPLAANALFRLASMSKPVTAVALMTLIEEGRLTLDTEVGTFIPSFAHMTVGKVEHGRAVPLRAASRPITVRHLLSHTSGLGSGEVGYAQTDSFLPKDGEKLCDIIPNYGNCLLDFEPQSMNAYSGHMAFDTLSYLCELLADMPFDEFVKKRVTDKLETDDLCFLPTPEQEARLIPMFGESPLGLRRTPGYDGLNFKPFPRSFFAGSCCMLGTLDAYMSFVKMLTDGGMAKGGRVLRPETVELMATRAFDEPCVDFDNGQTWGLSFRVITSPQGGTAVLSKGTFGWSGAYGTHFFIDRARDLGVVYMMNCSTAMGAGAFTAREIEVDAVGATEEK